MNANRIGAATAVLCLLTACTKLEEKAQTVDYYRAHPQERHALVRDCVNDPARARSRPACINAKAAELRESIGSVQDLPPMGLVPEGTKPRDVR